MEAPHKTPHLGFMGSMLTPESTAFKHAPYLYYRTAQILDTLTTMQSRDEGERTK